MNSEWIPYLCFALAGGCVSQPERSPEGGSQQSKLATTPASGSAALRATVRPTGRTVEVEVSSNQPFRDTALVPVLVIGDHVFSSSRNPPDGRLDTLIFSIDKAEFDALPDATDISVGYLAPSARLTAGRPGNSAGPTTTAVSTPQVRLDQVQPARSHIGKLEKASLEVRP